MCINITVKAKEVISKLKSDGWQELPGRRTSHKHFKHQSKPGKVTVPMHPGDITLETLKRIERQSGVDLA